MKRELHLALARLRLETFRKYVIFFLFIFFLFFSGIGVKKSKAAELIPSERHGQTITVTAVVPLSQEFAYLIRKNSAVFLEKSAFVLGGNGEIAVRTRGEKNAFLKEHTVELRIFNVRGEAVTNVSGKTDVLGRAYFHVIFDARFLGKNVIRVADTTYGEPLSIVQEFSFIVYETQDAREQAQKEAKKSIVGSPVVVADTFIQAEIFEGVYLYHKNVTIGIALSIKTLSRAGPYFV